MQHGVQQLQGVPCCLCHVGSCMPDVCVCVYVTIPAALCLWVARSFSNNNFSYVWPITFLR